VRVPQERYGRTGGESDSSDLDERERHCHHREPGQPSPPEEGSRAVNRSAMARTGPGSLPGETHSARGIVGLVREPRLSDGEVGRSSQDLLPTLPDIEAKLPLTQSTSIIERWDKHHYHPVDAPP